MCRGSFFKEYRKCTNIRDKINKGLGENEFFF